MLRPPKLRPVPSHRELQPAHRVSTVGKVQSILSTRPARAWRQSAARRWHRRLASHKSETAATGSPFVIPAILHPIGFCSPSRDHPGKNLLRSRQKWRTPLLASTSLRAVPDREILEAHLSTARPFLLPQ